MLEQDVSSLIDVLERERRTVRIVVVGKDVVGIRAIGCVVHCESGQGPRHKLGRVPARVRRRGGDVVR